MAKLVETLIALLLAAAVANTARSQGPSTYFNYQFGTRPPPTTLTYQEDAHYAAGTAYLRLTAMDRNDQAFPNRVGRVLHNAPVLFKYATGAQVSFETSFVFRISPNTGAGDNTPADGLAFFIAPVGSTPPESSSGGNLGIFDANGNAPNVFAVEIDIFRNNWDVTSDHHIGVDLGSRVSSHALPAPEGLVGKDVAVVVNYDANTKTITLTYYIGSEEKTTSVIYDLGNLLTDQVQVGLSASTGGFAACHEILSWTFSSNIRPPPSTSFSYNFFTERPAALTLQNDAHYASDTNFLVLTNPVNNNVGRALYATPVLFKSRGGAQATFQTTFEFIIGPNDGQTRAEGLAFFIAPVGSTQPDSSYGGNLGVFGADGNAPNVFAMEFDIFSNAGYLDPSFHHIGFDFGSRISTTYLQVSDGLVGKLVFATINYDDATKAISVIYNAGTDSNNATMHYDLGNLLTENVQVGLSASTGSFFARHEILSWSFNSTFAPATATAAGIRQVV